MGILGGMEPSTPDPGAHFGDEMWDLKSTGISLISLLGARIQMIPCDVTASRETINRPCSDHSVECMLIDWDLLWNANVFGVLSTPPK
ncbi:hypothetical protein AVEN_207182-1 [Araneus ventricosus]|uniref:Uncharacterized protein n=1 Tax=Araneus ventricosus TaxID=182803 RepID=A0A4Y2HV64_ARAVE|nr:hypothetical protein AVEN_207182-1 [Araneus ventricosus]